MPGKFIRTLLLLYGLLNAMLYSALLPLWEGFDEEFHYGYVQYLEAHHRFPVLLHTDLSQEINQSIGLLPMSYVMIRNLHLHGVRTFSEYFALSITARHSLHDQAYAIPTDLRHTESPQYFTNYEVHHAPLAYLLLAIPDSLLSNVPIPTRVLILRFIASIACTLLMFRGTLALAQEAGLEPPYAETLLFLVFSCQMFWATVAHIDNDWLSVPLAVWLIVFALRCNLRPSIQATLGLSAVMALGLLSKAYFLVFVPLYLLAAIVWYRKHRFRTGRLILLAIIPLLLSGPWYARNLIVYGNLSGRLEETSGGTTGSAISSLTSIPWLKSLPFMARGAFWMGNSSFTDFSILTMNLLLLLLFAALSLYIWTAFRRGRQLTDAFLWTPVLLFSAAMIYVTGSSYAYTKGLATAASPWYMQAVNTPLLCIAMLGCQLGRMGGWLAKATIVLWGYILAATYAAKLFPLYGGFTGGRSTLSEIAHWYLTAWPQTADILSTTALAPAPWLLALFAVMSITQLAAMTLLLREHR